MKKIVLASLAILLLDCCGPSKERSEGLEKIDSRLSESKELGAEARSDRETDEASSERSQEIQSGQITAAEWNDLKHWPFWDSLQHQPQFSTMAAYWSYDLSQRISIHLSNKHQEHIKNKKVELLNKTNDVLWVARTDNKGLAELWPSQKFRSQSQQEGLKIRVDNCVLDSPKLFSKGINELVIDELMPSPQPKVEIVYMVDATGSMGDELEFLKAELADVIARVKNHHPASDIHSGAVFYRDENDDYLTKKSDFTSGITETLHFIKEQSAGGGGDFPEAVHSALDVTVNDLQWSDNSTKLAFIILDAPPHHDAQIIAKMNQLTAQAAAKGIQLIPVVASGIDKETEFLMRYMAIATNGTYVFITNDSGIGNPHLEASVGKFQVEYLNKLMERVISERL